MNAWLGKIAMAAGVIFLIGAGGSMAFGFQPKFFSWDSKTEVLSNKDAESSSKTIDADGVDSVDVDLKLGAGKLTMSGGAESLMTGDFSYNKELKPEIDYKTTKKKGRLQIHQADPSFKARFGGHNANKWDVQLNNEIPLDLSVDTGASQSTLHLGDLKLQHLAADIGVGETTIDLSGQQDQSFDADIDSGVGQTTILLPKEVGVDIKVDKGIGGVDTSGLYKDGDQYVNEAFESSDATIDMNIDMGVGELNLKVKK